MSIGLDKAELAELAGYSYRQMYNINKKLPEEKKLFVEGEARKCDLAIFVQRWVDYNVAQATGGDADLDAVKARHEEVKMAKTELQVQQMRGELVSVHEVRAIWGNVVESAKKNLLQLANRIAPSLLMLNSSEMVSSIIDGEIRRVLEEIADTPLPASAAQEDDAEDDDE